VLLLGDRENYDSVERGNMTGLVSRPILVATIVDLAARRVVAHRAYTRNTRIAAVEPSRRGLVVLSAPAGKIGTAELGLVDTRGRLRVAPLGQVTAGFQRPAHGGEAGSRQNVPGLAVDAAHDRAYVVAAGSPVAEVALADLRVTYHRLAGAGRRPSVLAQLRRGLVPAAEAKVQSGPERHARWLGAGRLAVSGTNSDFRGEHDSPTGERRPSGLQIIDTRDWSVRTIDNDAGQVVLAANRLVTVGATTRLTDGDSTTKGAGLRIRAPGSRRPVQLYAGRPIQWIQAYGPYVYADLANNTAGQYQQTGYAVIDARTGKLVGEHQDRLIPVFLD
jgi:hypothetical protein